MIASFITMFIILITSHYWIISLINSDHINSIIDSSPIKVKTEEREEISNDDVETRTTVDTAARDDDTDGYDDTEEDDDGHDDTEDDDNEDDDDGHDDTEDDDDDDIPPHAKLGVDPIYIELFKKAQLLSKYDYASSHQHGKFGIVIGPTEGEFRHTLKALENGKRISSILQLNQIQQGLSTTTKKDLKLALMASPEHVQILDSCSSYMINQQPNKINITRFKEKMSDAVIENLPDQNELEEACRLWANGTLFDHTLKMNDAPYKHNDNHTNLDQGSSKYWLKALGGYRLAPYQHSLFLDSDSYPCPGVQKLFQLTDPDGYLFGKYWQLPVSGPGDLAIGVDQFAAWQNGLWIPGDKKVLSDCSNFAERNTGAVLFNFQRLLAHTLAHFIPLVSEHIYNNVATPEQKVVNDQVPFRVALYLFRRFQPDFVEHQIPMHASCRTYPGVQHSGTDGFLNGMYPLQHDGKPCKECSCTPCLINHTPDYPVTIGGFMGWEKHVPTNLMPLLPYTGIN